MICRIMIHCARFLLGKSCDQMFYKQYRGKLNVSNLARALDGANKNSGTGATSDDAPNRCTASNLRRVYHECEATAGC